MGKFVINGGKKLNGILDIQGAKNAVLPLFAAAILTNQKVIINNCPDLVDVHSMANILISLGAKVVRSGSSIEIESDNVNSHEIPCKLARELRSSIFLLGSVLGRLKQAKVAYPGGCDIGLRPIDIHLKGLRDLNVKIKEEYGYIKCDASNMMGGKVILDYPSVGATENVMLAAATAPGRTTIHNSAREPEIIDLQNFLNAMGAKISGAGSSLIHIEGVKKLNGTEYTTMPDRIVAGTFLIATAMCGGKVTLNNCNPEHIQSLIAKMSKSSCNITCKSDTIEIETYGRPLCIEKIETQPYPGFPTDLQAQVLALTTISQGTSIITENIFETRFKHVPELIKMGAQITVSGRSAIIRGVEQLSGTEVVAMDLRGGASLILAGLTANGTTTVNDIHHIERGYQDIHYNLASLGADISKF